MTLVLYFGTKHWDKPLTLHEQLGNIPEELKPYVNDYRINLFEIAYLTDEQVKMFTSDFRIVADYFVQVRKNKDYVPTDTQIKHVREVLELMSVLTDDYRFEEAQNSIGDGKECRSMCEVLDRVENRGFVRGIEAGHEAGRREGYEQRDREKIADMLRDGKSAQAIIDFCKYPKQLVEEVQQGISVRKLKQ